VLSCNVTPELDVADEEYRARHIISRIELTKKYRGIPYCLKKCQKLAFMSINSITLSDRLKELEKLFNPKRSIRRNTSGS
jgi:hypothetical protein